MPVKYSKRHLLALQSILQAGDLLKRFSDQMDATVEYELELKEMVGEKNLAALYGATLGACAHFTGQTNEDIRAAWKRFWEVAREVGKEFQVHFNFPDSP